MVDSIAMVPLGSSRSLWRKDSSCRLLSISLRSISVRLPPPPPVASVIIRSPFVCAPTAPRARASYAKAPHQYLTVPYFGQGAPVEFPGRQVSFWRPLLCPILLLLRPLRTTGGLPLLFMHPSAWRDCMKSPHRRVNRLSMRRLIAAYRYASPLAHRNLS